MADDDSAASVADSHNVVPALGLAWANLVTIRLLLCRSNSTVSVPQKNRRGEVIGSYGANVRTLEAMHAPHLPSLQCRFIIDADGVKGLTHNGTG